VRKSKRQIAPTDPNVAPIEQVAEPATNHSKPAQHKIRQEAEGMKCRQHRIKQQPSLQIERDLRG
jgi:hypothetical protein